MILSFHPCFVGDRNIICAGREPGPDERSAIQDADAVILPQGCRQSLYEMARDNCSHIFPNYDVRFQYPGKLGDIEFFKKEGFSHPDTWCYTSVSDLDHAERETWRKQMEATPFVFKHSWGGEGETVYLMKSGEEFDRMIKQAERYEGSGQTGFLIQAYIPTDRSLRIVVIGERMITYWRISNAANGFGTSLAKGAEIDRCSDPNLKAEAVQQVRKLCSRTGINLAAFDAIISNRDAEREPLFLEVNYFFGRRGLGGTEAYYAMLQSEIVNWLDQRGFSLISSASTGART
jgi:ribosomal protein S6--L-glutamate ligase